MPQQTQWQSGYCSSTLSYQSGSIWFVQQIAISSQYSHIRCRCNSRHDSNWANEVQEINAIIPWSTTRTGTSHTIWWQQKYERVIYATSKATQAPPYVIIQHYVGESLATEEYLCAFVNGKLKTKTRQISWVTNIRPTMMCGHYTQSTTFLERRYSQCTGILWYIWLYLNGRGVADISYFRIHISYIRYSLMWYGRYTKM